MALTYYGNQEQLLPLARTTAVFAEVFGRLLSEGTVERAMADCHAQLAETEAAIKHGVTATVAHFDEAWITLNGIDPSLVRNYTVLTAQRHQRAWLFPCGHPGGLSHRRGGLSPDRAVRQVPDTHRRWVSVPS